MDHLKREDENIFFYAERLIEGRKLGKFDLDKDEIYELLIGEKASSDHSRKCLSFLEKLLDKYEDEKLDIVESNSSDDFMKELELKRQEIIKEKMKVQTESIDLNRRLREQARAELFEEKVIDAILKRNKQIIVPSVVIEPKNYDDEMIISIADQHYGADFEIRGMLDEIINKYSPDIFEKRMWDMLNKIVTYAEKNHFKKANLIDLDDSIEGILHISQLSSLKYGVVDSIIGYADFMETWLNELSKYIYVDFNRVKGNHNDLRLLTSKKGDFPHENTSRIITHIIQKGLRDNKNISITGHNSIGCVYKKIAGFDMLATHGQDEKGNLEQSFKDYIIAYKVNVDYLFTGHLHSNSFKEVGINKECIQTPSLMGVNDYSMLLKKTANAAAKITVLSKELGRTDEYNMIFRY